MRPLTFAAMTLAALTAAPPEIAAQTRPDPSPDVAAWREDLQFLARELPHRHKNAFAGMTPAQWDSAVRMLDQKLPRLERHQIIVEIMRLVALVRDGHTFLAPELEEKIGFHTLPVRFYDFADGLFVIAADRAHASLAGARVVRIGQTTSRDALAAAASIVSRESPEWARFRGASLLGLSEVLAGLGLTGNPREATLVIEAGGREQSVTLPAAGQAAGGWLGGIPSDWVDARQAAPGDDPLWLREPGNPFWFTILPDRTMYIGYRAVQFFANGETNEQFFRRAFAAADSSRVERVVLDIRTNGGGNNFLNRFLVKEIIRRPALDQANRFLVLIGRGTFSAAQNLVNELDFYTNATFVGEPTGNAPNQYGDPRRLELPRSGIRILVSSLYWQGHMAGDTRLAFTPDLFIEMTSADYRARRDPVFETAVRWATGPTLAERLSPEAERGDTAAVRHRVEEYRTRAENRYRNVEEDLNGAGYELLRAGKTQAAITVFQVNTTLFPGSGNTHDSLGEALEKAGRRDQAIAAYRRALTLNPNLGSSRDGLRRLGASPP